jgi:hypothetical protein
MLPKDVIFYSFTTQGYTYDGCWADDKRQHSSLLTTSPLGDVRVSHWHKDHEYHGVSISGSTILIGQRFQDGNVKGSNQPFRSYKICSCAAPALNFCTLGSCIIMGVNDSVCLIVCADQRSPTLIQILTNASSSSSPSEWESTSMSTVQSPKQDPLV